MTVGEGIKEGTKALGNNLSSAVIGVISKPGEGYRQSGIAGAIGGAAKGVVGLIAKPAAGVASMVGKIAQGA